MPGFSCWVVLLARCLLRGTCALQRSCQRSFVLPISFSLKYPFVRGHSVQVEALQFDFTAAGAANGRVRYVPQPAATAHLTLTNDIAYLSLPAVRMRFSLNGTGERTASIMQAYETLDPFVRYHVLYQELIAHRYIWSVSPPFSRLALLLHIVLQLRVIIIFRPMIYLACSLTRLLPHAAFVLRRLGKRREWGGWESGGGAALEQKEKLLVCTRT